MNIKTALCENKDLKDNLSSIKQVEQSIRIQYHNSYAEYTVIRDIELGKDISDVYYNFQKIFPDDPQKRDREIKVLKNIFMLNDEDYTDLDQWLWDLDIGVTKSLRLYLMNYNNTGISLNICVLITILNNRIVYKN